MTYLLVVILEDLERLPALLSAWKRIGVPGVTLLHSVGGYRAETWLARVGLSGLSRLLERGEIKQRTLLSLIDDEKLLEQAIAEADEIVEGFDRPHSGILFVLPVSRALGLKKWPAESASIAVGETPGERGRLSHVERTQTVAELMQVLDLTPVTVPVHASVEEIVSAMLQEPEVFVACVVNEEKRLVGLIDTVTLANAFLLSVFPEEFLGELSELSEVEEFAQRTGMRRASDIMREPVWVRAEDTVQYAFHVLHKHRLPGVPVVDEHYRVVGYINLLELMGLCLRSHEPVQPNGEEA